ncbi:hypothetical protein AB0M50_33690 [Nonomuraea fuscirosea]|uniref:hypothetical protein n=1 Tax=Nonomuraea fuscirosea TaxID=1291556 RepID=UPI002DDBE2F8|nr:hypothetical protein [Nonomuraea fuscirosea]WSA49092.1 hypothetical protein OIE67_34070 [Nonomuraea fuscirosea]
MSTPEHHHLIPAGRRHRTVSRADFAAASRDMPLLDDRKYREDMNRHVNDALYDPYDRADGKGGCASDGE